MVKIPSFNEVNKQAYIFGNQHSLKGGNILRTTTTIVYIVYSHAKRKRIPCPLTRFKHCHLSPPAPCHPPPNQLSWLQLTNFPMARYSRTKAARTKASSPNLPTGCSLPWLNPGWTLFHAFLHSRPQPGIGSMSASMSATTMSSRRFVWTHRRWQNGNPKVWRTDLRTEVGARDACAIASKNGV